MNNYIFLHGALGSKAMFNSLIDTLDTSAQIHAIDLPGHGEREINHDFSIEYFANDLIEYIEVNKLKNVHVFGFSMGGYVALYAASLRPDLFNRIMTLATKFTWNKEIVLKETSMLNAEKMEQKIPAFVNQLIQLHPKNDWKNLVSQTSKMLHLLGLNPLLTSNAFSTINIPVLLGIGDKDSMVSIDETLTAYRELPNGSMYMMSSTKHPFEHVDIELLKYHVLKFFPSY